MAKGKIQASSFIVKGEQVADRTIRGGLRILSRHHRVEAVQEARAGSICGICSGWGHGEHNCAFPKFPRRALCAAGHRTGEHKCDVAGCKEVPAWPACT